MIKYGLISETDARSIENSLNIIFKYFPDESINCVEVGIFDGQTARGIKEYLEGSYRSYNYTGIDNEKYKKILVPFEGCKLIIGNSGEVYNQLEDNSQHFIFLDGCHSYPSVIQDFYCYRRKLKIGGCLVFHDTAPQAQGKGWQEIGDKNDPDMSISVRKALMELAHITRQPRSPNLVSSWAYGFIHISDTWDSEDEFGGTVVIQKIHF